MKENQDILIKRNDLVFSTPGSVDFNYLNSKNNEAVRLESNITALTIERPLTNDTENFLVPRKEAKIRKKRSDFLLRYNSETNIAVAPSQGSPNLFRLFVKNGEYVYARANDIIMMESCDHLVKVYLAFNDKIKKTIRHNTLKDFLLQLPQGQFIRIGRFCAINIQRLSGGNCNEQTFEFDFRVSIKLKHAISHSAFYTIGK